MDEGPLGGGGVASSSSPSSGEEVIALFDGRVSGDAPAGRFDDMLEGTGRLHVLPACTVEFESRSRADVLEGGGKSGEEVAM